MVQPELVFEVLSSDLIQRTGRYLGAGYAQLLGFGEHFFVLQAKFFRNIVDTDGHKCSSLRAAAA